MVVFNVNNTAHLTAQYPIFLGQQPALYDSVNKVYPRLFDLYKKQKAIDWSEDEINLQQSRVDMERCDPGSYDIMIKTLAFQWELDSVACRSIAPLLSPFISNSEYWAMIMKQSEIEILHALTYSEIVRQCVKNPTDVFDQVMKNEKVLYRAKKVLEVFNQIEILGAQYKLGLVTDMEHVRQRLLVTVAVLYALEGIEFMSSFAITFAYAEQDMFMGIAQLVQKIMADEQLHTMMDRETVRILLQDADWKKSFAAVKWEIKAVLDDILKQELSSNKYIFSEGRSLLGMNVGLLDEYNFHRAEPIYNELGIKFDWPSVKKNPLPWMANWMDIDSQQNANQEQDNNNYRLNSVISDLSADEVLDF